MSEKGNPDDATLLAQLESTAGEHSEAWARVIAVAEEFAARPHAEDDAGWSRLETQGDVVVRGGYPIYSERVERAHRALAEVGAITPAYHWMQQAPSVSQDGDALSPADAIRMATAIFRGERFGYGTIGMALEQGRLQAILASLAAWHRNRP